VRVDTIATHMQLVYLDESGNSGLNLKDPFQPVFLLCALIVAEDKWQALETDLRLVLDAKFPNWKTIQDFEVHASDLRSARGCFKDVSVADRIALRDAWMEAGIKHGVKLIARSINKKPYGEWLAKTFGQGIVIHPYVAAFAWVSRCVDNYLSALPGKPMGILIADENKEVVADVEKSIVVLREMIGPLRFSQIIEKGFFIESHKSLPLQLCDLFEMSLRKKMEANLAVMPLKPIDESGTRLAESILIHDTKHDSDVLQWLSKQHAGQKK
jgi:hypothetical protein